MKGSSSIQVSRMLLSIIK